MEFTLLWAALTAVLMTWIGTRIWSEGLPDHATDRLVGAAAVGLLVGRVTAMLTQGANPLTHPADILIVRGGVNSGLASLGAIVTYLWSTKWRLQHLDAIAPAALFGLAGWHFGCIWRGACLGDASTLPWAWSQEGSLVTRHPVELYTALALAGAAVLVARLPWRTLTKAGAGLILASTIRLLTESLRPSITGGPIGWYLAGVVVGVTAIVFGPHVFPGEGANRT